MQADFGATFEALKPVLGKYGKRLTVKTDNEAEYTVLTKKASPFPQHKGQLMFFASVRRGKAYVSFHLLPLYMCPELTGAIPAGLKKRMQGKACFNFKNVPEPETLAELKALTAASVKVWTAKKWM
jgi:hypothetical protein